MTIASIRTSQNQLLLHGKSDIGMVREDNQDSFCIQEPPARTQYPPHGHLLVLADGMGGLARGDMASRMAVEAVREVYYTNDGDPARVLAEAVQEANRRIFRETRSQPGNHPMGSTLTAAAILGDHAVIAQVGDSRAYRISPQEGLRKLTRDHTLVQELADRGEIAPDSLPYFIHRNVLTRGLGLLEVVETDIIEVNDLKPGETLFLCSDGLYDVVADSEIESQVLAHGSDLVELVDGLISLGRSRGAPDNLTILVARIEEKGAKVPEALARASKSSRGRSVLSGEEWMRSIVLPLSYFIVFALGVLLTLHFEAPRTPADATLPEAVEQLLRHPDIQDHFRDPSGQPLLDQLERLRERLGRPGGRRQK